MQQQQVIKTARLAGIWYLMLAVSGIVGFMVYHPQVFVNSNPAKTLSNLINHTSTARTRLVCELVIIVSQALCAVWFYKLFYTVHKSAAFALALWGTVNAIVIMVSAIAMSAALNIANTSITALEQKTISIQLLLQIITNAWAVGGLFFGLWLLPMGYIIIRSRRMPVWLGRLLILGGFGYLLQTFINCIGVQSSYTALLVMPATIGELWMIGYLLLFGMRPATDAESSTLINNAL